MATPMDLILSTIERKNQQRKANALNDIFAKSYEPGAAIPFVDESAEAMGLPQEPGMISGFKPGRINVQNALAQMAQSKEPGFAMQAFQLQQDMDAARSQDPFEKLKMEYALKDASENRKLNTEYELKSALEAGQMDRAKALFKELGGGGGYGTEMKIGPKGPEISFDPSKAASTELDQRKFAWESGGPGISAVSGGGNRTAIPPKAAAEAASTRLKALQESASQRTSALDTAEKFLDMFEKNKMQSGAARQAAGFIPGVYSKQGQLDEEFNAFSETAARQALKAAGEQRPTDADVKGMKQAMFGTGRDEETNKILLKNYIDQQLKDENAYRELTGQPQRQAKVYAGVTDTQATKNAPKTPKQGDIDSGYVFIGGDPASSQSWIKAK